MFSCDQSPSGRRARTLSPAILRMLSERSYDHSVAQLGEEHRATHAALGRFIAAWGERFEQVFDVAVPAESQALERALYRATGADGYMNRGLRKHYARKCAGARVKQDEKSTSGAPAN